MKEYTKCVKCPDCGKTRLIRKDSKSVFCMSCANSRKSQGEKPNRKTGKMVPCVSCGKEFYKRPSEGPCCSTLCGNVYGGKRRRAKKTDIQRFWENVEKSNGCWVWKAAVFSSGGYGAFLRCDEGNRGLVRANRFSWEIHFGPIPKNTFICHRCDNPPCVRPEHLFLGSHKQNMADLKEKGRWWSPKRINLKLQKV